MKTIDDIKKNKTHKTPGLLSIMTVTKNIHKTHHLDGDNIVMIIKVEDNHYTVDINRLYSIVDMVINMISCR